MDAPEAADPQLATGPHLGGPRLLGPTDRITVTEAAHILGCSVDTARRHVLAERLHEVICEMGHAMSRIEVESMAAELYPWRRHVHDAHSYWVTGARAAALLGVTIGRLDQLSEAHRIPFVRHEDGTRLYRRTELALMPRV